jgi:cobalt/nickel transport system permease protein
MHYVLLETWSRGASGIHRLDARAKVLTMLVFLVVLATTPGSAHAIMAGYLAIVIAGITAAGLPLLKVVVRAAAVLPFAAVFSVMTIITGDVQRAIALAEKSYLSALVGLWVVATTPLPEILRALGQLGAPTVALTVIQFLHRYLSVLIDQAQRMRLAALCRGGQGKRTRSLFQAAASSLGVLFARSYSRAEGIHNAMLARCFNGRLRTLSAQRFLWKDAVFLAGATGLTLSLRLAAV